MLFEEVLCAMRFGEFTTREFFRLWKPQVVFLHNRKICMYLEESKRVNDFYINHMDLFADDWVILSNFDAKLIYESMKIKELCPSA